MQKTSRKKIAPKLMQLVISLSFFSLCFCLSSCYEPIEGCLDVNSSNYLVSADRACDSCCVYPAFNLNIKTVFNGEDFLPIDTLVNTVGDSFQLTDFYFVLSRFNLTQSDGLVSTSDTTEFLCNGVTTFLPNDLVVVAPSSSFSTVGSIQSGDGYTAIDFLLGLDDCSHDTGLNYIDEDNELNLLDTLFNSSVGFTTLFVELNDSLRIQLQGQAESLNITKPLLASNELGNPLVLDLNVDFGVWLSDIKLDEGEEAIKAKIVSKVSEAISISQ